MGLAIYKRGQGKYTRLCSAFACAIIVGAGCWRLYHKLTVWLTGIPVNTKMWVERMVPVGLFGLFALFIFWFVNRASVADFMIASEGEMKKVSWSSKQEIIVSTTIVIVVVILTALLLGATDLTFNMFFKWLFK
ncbi:MAG: preprotein translocase subunit SecE [Planctomycetota bacterium]|jgi:preprotein translocase subunit SecE